MPWPHTFVAFMSKISLINLNFFHLPAAACLNPNLSFYTEFLAYTFGFLAILVATASMWTFGVYALAPFSLRGLNADEVAQRRAVFTSRILQRTLMFLYLVYPGVSVTIFGMFTCTSIGNEELLVLDMRIKCKNGRWWQYFAGAIVWVVLVPIGVPVFFNRLLHRYKVPQMARLVEDNAWLREAAEHTWRLGMPQPAVDMQRLCVDTIDDAHLAMLHAVLLLKADKEKAGNILHGTDVSMPVATEKHSSKEHAKPQRRHTRWAALRERVTQIKTFVADRINPAAALERLGGAATSREKRLAALLSWCRNAGVLAIQAGSWSDDLNLPEEDEKCEYPAHHTGLHSCQVPGLLRKASQECGFLFTVYTTQCWYWESVELLRKLALTSILALITPGTAGQVVIGCLVALALLLANIKLKPFASRALNFVNQGAQLNLFLLLFTGLLLKVNLDGDDSKAFYDAIISMLAVLPLAMPVALHAYIMLGGWGKDAKEDMQEQSDEATFGDDG